MNGITTIWTGHAGLARTYWAYGVVGAVAWGLALSVMTPGAPATIAAVIGFCLYFLAVNVGVWRAASTYTGAQTWAMLAKVASSLGMVFAVAAFALVLVAMGGGDVRRSEPAISRGPALKPSSGTSEAPVPHANEDGPWKKYQQ